MFREEGLGFVESIRVTSFPSILFPLQEQVHHQFLIGVHRVFCKIGNTLFPQHFFVYEKVSRAFERGPL